MNIKKEVEGDQSQIHYNILLLPARFDSCEKATSVN